jgi:integrase
MGDRKGVELREKSIRIGFSVDGKWTRETLKLAPTPANEKYAANLLARIKKAQATGTFDYGEFFPNSKRAPVSANTLTFGQACDNWMATKGRLATKTKTQYANALGVWRGMLGKDTPIGKLTHTLVAGKVGSHPWASAKLLNNYLIPLRGVFKLAGRELSMDNPMDGIENSRHQSAKPDPLTAEEALKVVGYMGMNFDKLVHSYFAFAFATGMRPEEIIALRWTDWDRKAKTMRVERAKTSGEVKPLKTYEARDVDLTTVATEVLEAIQKLTKTGNDGHIFRNPVTRRPWHDDRAQREGYWTPALKALHIKPRRAYCTRHTYATTALMGGVNPAYIARQLGHKNAMLLFKTYSKWIDMADGGRERAKMEQIQVNR